MKNKIIAFDLDGTLARNDSYPSEFTYKTIEKLSQEGYFIVLCTGRSWVSTKHVYINAKLKTPVVLCNGNYVFNPTDGQVFRNVSIEKSFIKKIMEDDYLMSMLNNILCEYEDKSFFYKQQDIWPKAAKDEKVSYGDLQKIVKNNPNSMCLYPKTYEDNEKVVEYISKISDVYAYRHWGGLFGEIYRKDCSKKEGIDALLEHYNKTKKDLIFFGDGVNDMEIIKYADIGIAMKNSYDPRVIAIADEVSEYSNEEDGAIRHLLKMIKEGEV